MITYSIIKKSQLEGALRMDAEYYQPEYLELENRFTKLEKKTLEEVSESITSFGAYSLTSHIEWQDSGVPYINVGDIHDGYIDFSNVKYISEKVNDILQKSKVSNRQVLLTMAGTIGNAAVVNDLKGSANANQAIAKINPIDNMSPYYLAAFLNSKYGLLQTQREIVSSVQANIFLGQIKEFQIPIFGQKITKEIENKYKIFLNELENSKKFYSQAENLLLEELGLKDFKEEESLFSITNLSDVKNANRIDAEYFQSKYEKLISKIKNKNAKNLESFVKEYSTGFPFKSENYQEEGIPLIRINNIKKGFLDLNDAACLSEKDFALSPDDIRKSSINQRILRITPKNIDKDYLTLLLNSIIGSYQLQRIGTGGVQTNISYKDIKNILMPELPKNIQEKIADLVKKSHQSRKKAKELLEEAKQKVEKLIENK